MKQTIALGLAVVIVIGAAALSGQQKAPGDRVAAPAAALKIEQEQKNPWTHLRLNGSADEFNFAVVSDRTGGHRAKIFSQAVDRLNLMQPEFVVSVGDLIEGYSEKEEKVEDEWKEFNTYVNKLQMPFFYVPGNHDITNRVQEKIWKDRFGRSYYHFVYKNVLFLLLNSEDPPLKEGAKISPEQIAYVKKALEDNPEARWTLVFLHKPLWVMTEPEKTGWPEVEKLLNGRNYTVFAGHVHRYQKFVRQGMNYYQLATTGGGSKLRGLRYGEFDHFAWITMKKSGPVIANVMLDGVLREDLTVPDSEEEGVKRTLKPVFASTGTVTYKGQPVPNATVVLYSYSTMTKKYTRTSDALSESDGGYTLSTYKAFDGVPAGEYSVTVVWREPMYDKEGKATKNKLPEEYSKPETTPLKAKITEGRNTVHLELK